MNIPHIYPVITSIDQIGNTVTLTRFPQRIVSLVPSQTAFLFHIGVGERIVGTTDYCTHPPHNTCRVGGTKNFNVAAVLALQPDLVVANKEENHRGRIEKLMAQVPVWVSDVHDLPSALQMMRELGRITGKEDTAQSTANQIAKSFDVLKCELTPTGKSCAYFIWRKPYMVAGSGTFIHNMIDYLGLKNVYANYTRYPKTDADELRKVKPDYIFLSSEPYNFNATHIDEFRDMCPQANVLLVDGELFSWYGSTLLKTPDYFRNLYRIINI